MNANNELLTWLLQTYPWLHAAWLDRANNPTQLHLAHAEREFPTPLHLPTRFNHLKIIEHHSQPVKPLIAPLEPWDPNNTHHQCQNEPIQCGCQIQPQNATWVGTAGAPCRWLDLDRKPTYGILSNWHVMAAGYEHPGRRIHQPTIEYPTAAHLTNWLTVTPNAPNTIDAALADARITDFHTISDSILELGPLDPQPHHATVGLQVLKSGRTTGLTRGRCTAVGAAARVDYGSFITLFTDQDVFTPTDGAFSAPGDSGSLIVCEPFVRPTALLFAGSPQLTLGNPIRHIISHFGLSFTLT